MKKILLIFVILFSLIGFSVDSKAGTFDSIMGGGDDVAPYCDPDDDDSPECNLSNGIKIVKAGVDDIEKDRNASQYIQDVVGYSLKFISIVAVIYVIYAGFVLLTSAGDEEKAKSTKKTVLFVILGIVLMWMAYPIINWILEVLSN